MKKKNFFQVLFLGTALMTGFYLTSCDNGSTTTTKVDPSTIATTNLVAYFPFDNNATETIANLTPTAQPLVTYVTGRRGKAYQGAEGAHLLYTLPTTSKLKTLTSFSVAMWFKSPLVTGDPEVTIFQIGKSDDLFWGNLTLALNRLSATADSLAPKAYFLKSGAEWSGQHIGYTNTLFQVNQWMHLIFEYDGATSKYVIYKDGVKIITNTGVEDRKAGPTGTALGNLLFDKADVINIGAWRPKSEGTATDVWMGWFKGNLDELRIYDKALNATDAKKLYDAEVSQML
jgi:hypothetical protein